MEYLIICLTAFLASGLTLFSGFGLGTILLPAFALFFPVDISVALTAIVHFLNNIFKLTLLGKNADKTIVLKFGIPAILFALLGAYLLTFLADLPPLIQYSISGKTFVVTPIKLTIAFLLIFFSLFDLIPKLSNLKFDKKYLPLGGVLSGFFGGLSGNQGALRSAFLIRAGLSKEAFIATGVVIACLIDFSRLIVYSKQIIESADHINYYLMISATFAAFIGAFTGTRLIKKITLKTLHYIVAVMLFIFAILLGTGII
ncbi:MAG: sulfite exporter TauE/SafE family protein [Ignavibacteriales bacterium]|nr:MAG: sulfite exporter TauE/SafE family protein [Ignavibacteriales bacterium]